MDTNVQHTEAHPPGMYWTVHHDVELEWCHDYGDRANYINTMKPEWERAERLRWFQPVRGQLPEEVVKTAYGCDQARAACDQARAACDQARAAREQIWATRDGQAGAAFQQIWAVFQQARAACDQAWVAYQQACAAYERIIAVHQPAITELHRAEQPDSPWNGKELVLPKSPK